MTTEEEVQFALAFGLLAKAVHRLQRVGLNRDAEEIIREAEETLGLQIIIKVDPTIKNN